MHAFSRTKLKRDALLALAVAAVAAFLVVGFVLILRMEPRLIDEHETPGEPPNAAEIRGYTAYAAPDVCQVRLCGEPTLDGGYANLYLTNPAANDVLLCAELYSVKVVKNGQTGQQSFQPDKLIGKTGFLHPGTYVQKVKVKGIRQGEENWVMVKISTMFEDSRMSNGFFYIRMTVQG